MIDDAVFAFPRGEFASTEWRGMTLRDYFAAKAMAQILADNLNQKEGNVKIGEISLIAYQMADAMLAARGSK